MILLQIKSLQKSFELSRNKSKCNLKWIPRLRPECNYIHVIYQRKHPPYVWIKVDSNQVKCAFQFSGSRIENVFTCCEKWKIVTSARSRLFISPIYVREGNNNFFFFFWKRKCILNIKQQCNKYFSYNTFPAGKYFESMNCSTTSGFLKNITLYSMLKA